MDNPLKISNNVFEVIQSSIQSIDSMALFIINSASSKKETVDAVADGAKNIKKTINVISDSLSSVVMALAELEVKNFNAVIDAGSIFMISSIKMAMNINKGDQFKGPALIIASYAKLIKLISELSEYSQNINTKAIKKASKATSLVFDYLYRTQRRISRKSKILLKLGVPAAIDTFFEATNNVINKVTETLTVLGNLIQTFESIGGKKARRQTRRAIKTIFGIYIDTVVGAIQLGELLFTGTLTKSYLIPKKFRSKTYGVGPILKALVSLIAMTGYFNIVFKLMAPISEQLNFIGENSKYIERGLTTLWVMLYGNDGKYGGGLFTRDIPGLLDIMTRSRSLTMSRVKKLAITGILLTSFLAYSLLLRPIISTLITIGSNKIKIIGGLILMEMMLLNGEDSRIKSLTYVFTKLGEVKTNKIINSIKIVASITLLTTMMFVVYTSLSYAGKNYKNIKRGLKATSLILLGSNGFLGIGKKKSLIQIISSITPEDTANIIKSIKPILMLTVISVLLNIITLNLAIIGRRKRYIKRGVQAIKWLNRLLEIIDDINTTIEKRGITTKKIWNVAKIIMLISGFLVVISFAMTLIGMNLLGITLAIPALLLMRVALILVVWLANYLSNKGEKIAKSTVIFGAVGRLLFRMAKIFLLFIAASLTFAAIATATVSMLAIIGGMTLAILAILAISLLPLNKISISTLMLIAIALTLFIMAKVFVNISDTTQKIKMSAIGSFIGMILVVAIAFTAIGLVTPLLVLAVVGAAAMTLIGFSLLILIVPLMILASIDPGDLTNAKINATLVIETSISILRSFMDAAAADVKGGKKPETWTGRIITGLFGSAGIIVEAILAFAFIALTFVTVTLLILTAVELSLLEDIKLNPTNIEDTVDTVIGTALKIIEAVCGRENPKINGVDDEKKGLFGTIFKGLGDVFRGIRNIVDGILTFGFVAMTFLTIGMITLIAKNLQYLEKIKINRDTVEKKVDAVIGTANSLINHIKGSNVEKSDIKKAELTKKFMKQIKKTVEYMSKIGEMNNQGQFDRAIDSYVRFVDKVNTVKVENIEKTAKMFEKMAEFSKSIHGNFEGLADTLNDKITPLLEKIDSTLKNTESSLADTNKTLQDTGDKVSGISAVTGADAMVKTSKGEDGKTVTTVDSKGLVNAISEIGVSISEIRKTISKFDRTIITDGLDQAVKTINKPTS